MESHWSLFNERVVQPLLNGSAPPALSTLCERYGVPDVKKGSNMIMTMKRRFRSALMKHVGNTVASKEQASAEMEELLKFLPQTAQPPEKTGE